MIIEKPLYELAVMLVVMLVSAGVLMALKIRLIPWRDERK